MKIGILTFHYCNNYGAVLQAYALKTYLSEMSHDVYMGDYKLPILLHRYDFIPNYIRKKSLWGQFKYLLRSLQGIQNIKKKKSLFEKFRKEYLIETSLMDKDVDCWIVGSDQVWNPRITGGYDDVYYGNLISDKPVIFYAVSCPADLLDEAPLKRIKEKKYSVGVRELPMKAKLTSFGINSTMVVDPTFLLSKEQWEKLYTSPVCDSKYLFSYNITGNKILPMVANVIAADNKWVNTLFTDYLSKSGPIEFINLFRCAEGTLVSSFHGTAFSIVFHRPFLYFPTNDSRDERVFSLLKALDLEDCIYSSSNKNLVLPNINWDIIDIKARQIINKSHLFILSSLNAYECKR